METIVSTIRRARDSERPSRPQGRVSQLPRLVDAMERDPVLFRPHDCIREALRALLGGPADGGLVVDASGRLIGELSVTVCLRVLASGAYHAGSFDGCRPVGDVMGRDPVVVDEGADPFALVQELLSKGNEVAAILRDGRVYASVSRRHLLLAIAGLDDPHCAPQAQDECRRRRAR